MESVSILDKIKKRNSRTRRIKFCFSVGRLGILSACLSKGDEGLKSGRKKMVNFYSFVLVAEENGIKKDNEIRELLLNRVAHKDDKGKEYSLADVILEDLHDLNAEYFDLFIKNNK